MRRAPGDSASALALATVLVTSGCGSTAPPADAPAPVPAASEPSAFFRVDPGTAGTVRGTVTVRGAMPRPAALDMSAEAGCVAQYGGKPVLDEVVMVGAGGTVANAFVYIKAGLEGKKFERPADPVVLDQQRCLFTPRVVGVQAGAALAVRNSDPLEHNVHPGPKNNYEWNESMSPGAADAMHRFARHEVMIRVKCNIHPWMRAWIGVVEHPYFAVTGRDGAFEWKNVPPGDYTIAAWHERLGELVQPVTLAVSGSTAVAFRYDGEGREQ